MLSVPLDDELDSLLHLNMNTNKSYVAIKKILQNHPYYSNALDMEPFFEWNMEGEGERNLKALPYVIAWFDKNQLTSNRIGSEGCEAIATLLKDQIATCAVLISLTIASILRGRLPWPTV